MKRILEPPDSHYEHRKHDVCKRWMIKQPPKKIKQWSAKVIIQRYQSDLVVTSKKRFVKE
jgi:hypothetical protein